MEFPVNQDFNRSNQTDNFSITKIARNGFSLLSKWRRQFSLSFWRTHTWKTERNQNSWHFFWSFRLISFLIARNESDGFHSNKLPKLENFRLGRKSKNCTRIFLQRKEFWNKVTSKLFWILEIIPKWWRQSNMMLMFLEQFVNLLILEKLG